ncbi:polyamine transporter 1 [Verticillium alfalfae VaMs.102]|uniref:Polyamine transporter 1 n=1 Tax=Verticillium alfalfae (strain VaMs.102 / ATCC MYA-4576 / FGSC 10136) TaxID=526221 RepID=C9S5B1_VERA1|nr:polyamine transporter 1 [Verticillium alfalfae VaMs.102]EEY15019.1 polyamine transporter 1 [Verticillium alfalfae VaMs.102]
MSIFVLAYALGPLAWGPLSELYGRIIVLQLTNLFYMFFNLGCGLAQTKGQMIAFRFLAGLGGSAPMAIGGGVLSDLFTAEERGRAMGMYSLTPLLGPALGPIAGGYVTQETTWRWIFYSTTILTATIQAVGFFVLQETFTPVLLARRKARLMKQTGNEALHTEFDHPDRTVRATLATALTRPFRLLATQLIIQTRVYALVKRRRGAGVGRPEFRVPMMVPGAVLVPAGLLVYGWTAEARTHWMGPNVGAALFAMGTIIGFQCVQGFLVDSYTRYAASAVGAATVLRSLAGFGFPLFGPDVYASLGYGWGNTVLAGVGVVIGWPGPWLLWRFGEGLRKKSPYAAGA